MNAVFLENDKLKVKVNCLGAELRSIYGKEKELHAMMQAWLQAWCRPGILHFGQELHPITGEPSQASEWYSTTMLYLLVSMHELGLEP